MTDTPEYSPAPIPTERELASFDHRTVSSPIELIGDVRITAEPSLSMLSPEMQESVNAKMANVKADHAIFLKQFIREELEENSNRLKVLAGPGKDANEYQREAYGIARETYDIESEIARIEAELEQVASHRTEYDDNGNAVAVPVYALAPETRQGRREALQDARYRLAQLEREAPGRLAAAAEQVRTRIADQNEQLAIHAEAKRKAPEILRQQRIDRLANALANNRRDTIG